MTESIHDVIKRKLASGVFNPFPGLRPFTIHESHLFFGREEQTDEVLAKLVTHRFIAIIGPSGSGKSSFIHSGVVPVLYGGFIENARADWHVITTRPGNAPIDNLAEALLSVETQLSGIPGDVTDRQMRKTVMATLLRSNSSGLIEAISRQTDSHRRNFLLLVDQFEELFRFKKNEENADSVNESAAYLNLLVEAVLARESSIYVAITMRSDYIGECAQFPSLTALINESYYLIPQMTRDQKRLAISGPVAVGGGIMASRLVQQLLNDLGDNPDQLPILQHALMRTWDYWIGTRESGEPLDIQHYEAIGGMQEALSQHANEAYEELTESQKVICEQLFKVLTEKGSHAYGIRRPSKLMDIAAIAGVPEAEVADVVEKFRQPGRELLTPPHGIALHAHSVIDLSHESLMRIWVRLRLWVDEEAEAVEMYLRLAEAATKYQVGQAGLWRPPDLQLALNWQAKHKPTLVWGQRYDPAFERAIVFLETSRKAYETEQRVKDILQKRTLRKTRFIALLLGLAVIISIGFLIFAFTQQVAATEQAELARQNEQRARTQTALAQTSEQEARRQKLYAEREREQAKKQEQIALDNARIAQIAQANAEASAREAKKQQRIAYQQRVRAEDNERTAVEQQGIAVRERNNAYNLRLLSIAQAMAVKSLQITNPELKLLAAQQAYQFNLVNQGKDDDPYIYDGLYYAMKKQREESFNNLRGHTDLVRALASSASSQYVYSAGSDGAILRWDSKNLTQNYTTVAPANGIINRTLAISADSRWLACGSEDTDLRLFDLDHPDKKPQRIKTPLSEIWMLAYTSDAAGIILSDSVSVYSYDFKNFQKLYASDAKINALTTNPRRSIVAAGSQKGQILMWDMIMGNRPSVLFENPGRVPITAVAFSNQGKWLAAGDERGVVRIWNMNTRELVATLTGHTARVNNVKFDWSDRKLATGSWDKTVRLWNTAKWNDQPIVLKDHTDWVWSITFSADGEKLMAGCKDRMVRVWPTNAKFMADMMCEKLRRNMSKEEWDTFVGTDIPYERTCASVPDGEGVQR